MKLRSVAVNQFKKFSRPVRLAGIGDGLNVVIGPNEMGKSTLLDALRAVLFEKHNSKAQPIVALQNDRNEAAPVVELAFELGDGVYRITKRFIKKPYARLSCPDGRMLEGDAAEDTLRSLLGFDEPGKAGAKAETLGMWSVLWVQQGQSFGQFEISSSARSSLHSALEAEVGTVLGGRRGRALPQVIETQLGALLTSAGKPRGPYKDLIDRVDGLREELTTLQQRRKDLSQTFAELEIAQESLGRLSSVERDQADQAELTEARQRYGHLAELEARISSASIELELKNRNLVQAEKTAQDRQCLKDDIKGEETTLEGLGNRLATARDQEKAARSQLDALRTNVREAEATAAKADVAVSRALRLVAVIGRATRICELEKRCAKAQEAEERQHQAQEKAAAILVTDKSLATIRKAQKDLETVASRLSAAATLVSFDIVSEQRHGIEVDGRPLGADESSIQAVQPISIDIPDRGRITIDPAIKDREELTRQSRDMTAKLKDALTAAGVATAADAEDQYAIRQSLLQNAEIARQEAEIHAPKTDECSAGAQALASYIEGIRTILNREKAELDLNELPVPTEAERMLFLAQEHVEESREALNPTRGALVGPEEVLMRLQSELAAVRARYEDAGNRVERLRRRLIDAAAETSDEELETAIQASSSAISEQEEIMAGLIARRTDESLPQLEARIGRLERAIQDRRDKRASLKEGIAGLRSRIEAAEAAGLDEAVAQKSSDLEFCEKERDRFDREVKVLSLLISILRNAEREAKELYLSPVLRRVRPYLQLLFPAANIRIDEEMRVTGVVREADYEEAFHHLSMGTQEQIAVLIRLAFAEMLVEQGHPATVVLDDALVFSDDRRMKRMFDILNMAARNVQILVLTCREQLFEELGGRTLSLTAGSGDELISA